MPRHGFVLVLPIYCGMECKPVCSDIYGDAIYITMYDKEELRRKLMEMPIEELKKLVDLVDEFERWYWRHMNVCGTMDCFKYRSKEKYNFNKEILDRVGVKYEEKRIERCEPSDDVRINIIEEEPMDVVLDVAIDRGLDVETEIY